MLEIGTLRAQWVLLALLGGAAVTLLMVLGYAAMWQPRRDVEEDEPVPPRRRLAWWFRDVPWILILSYAVAVVFTVLYVSAKAANPPNW